jgi:type I restriction enzyme S subunit
MELKHGYKQTEVGVIPEDWEVKALGEIGEVLIGLTYKPTDVRQHGTLVLRSSNIQNEKLAFDDNVFVETTIPERIRVQRGDVLVCVRNGSRDLIGKSVLLDERTEGMTFGAFMAVYRSQIGNLASYLFQSSILKRQINEHLGATINQITNKSLNSFRIPIPPTEVEQQAIAEALSDVDGLLGGLDRLIAKKRDLKQAAMQQLLTGQTRLPGFQGEWEVKRLGDLFSFKNGLNKGKEFFGYGTPIVNYMDVFGNTGILCSKLEGRVSLTKQEIKNFDIRKGDVLFTRTSEIPEEIGMSSVILDDPNETVFSGFVLRGRPKNDILCDAFKAYCLRAPLVRNQIISKASYTTRALTNGRILSVVSISVPTKAEQISIAEVLLDMDEELAALELRRDKTRALKQAMMQELLTGRTRLV